MAIAIGSIRDLLLPGLMDITGEYKDLPNFYGKIFSKRTSNLQIERSVAMRYLNLAQLKNEGGATAFDNNAGERWAYNMEPVEAGLGYAITRKAIDDNLYKSQFRPTQLGLNMSFNQFLEREAANIFNNGNSTITGLGGDGVALIATNHPYDGGTWANTPTVQADLNESSLLDGQTGIRSNFVNEAGLKIYARAKRLIVPNNLQRVAIRLMKSELRPGTGDNDVNAITHMDNGTLGDYISYDYLTNTRAWFIQTTIDGLIFLDRVPYETDMWVDNYTDNLLVKGYQRFGFFYNDPRCLWGNYPTG